MEKLKLVVNGSSAKNVEKLMFGDDLLIKDAKKNIGFIYGLKKVIRSDNLPGSPGTANLNSNISRTIGFKNNPRRSSTTPGISTLSLMVRTFIRKTASSL